MLFLKPNLSFSYLHFFRPLIACKKYEISNELSLSEGSHFTQNKHHIFTILATHLFAFALLEVRISHSPLFRVPPDQYTLFRKLWKWRRSCWMLKVTYVFYVCLALFEWLAATFSHFSLHFPYFLCDFHPNIFLLSRVSLDRSRSWCIPSPKDYLI